MDIRQEKLPELDDQNQDERQKVFQREQSIFADFKVDTERVI